MPRNIEVGILKKRLGELRARIPNLTEEEMLEADSIETRLEALGASMRECYRKRKERKRA